MKALDRKLLRDLRLMWSQAITIALVVGSGIGGFITTLSAVDSLAVARDSYYQHNDPEHSDCDRQNADSHLRAVVVGHSLSIPVENGRLKLGTWQQVLFTEFDGPNTRRLHVQVMGI